jgi:hypothetical protein
MSDICEPITTDCRKLVPLMFWWVPVAWCWQCVPWKLVNSLKKFLLNAEISSKVDLGLSFFKFVDGCKWLNLNFSIKSTSRGVWTFLKYADPRQYSGFEKHKLAKHLRMTSILSLSTVQDEMPKCILPFFTNWRRSLKWRSCPFLRQWPNINP